MLGFEKSLFSSKILGEERKTRKHSSLTVRVTCEGWCREPSVAWALLSTPALLAARGIGVTVTVRLARLFCVPPAHFLGKERETARSLIVCKKQSKCELLLSTIQHWSDTHFCPTIVRQSLFSMSDCDLSRCRVSRVPCRLCLKF